MDNYNPVEVAQGIMDAVQKEYKDLKKLNVMILGKTGVGKSTLINNMFSKKIADTGTGKPVTNQIHKYELPEYPLSIYDTPGLELKGENDVNNLLDQVIKEIKKGIDSGDISQMIHCIWYCVNTPSHRFEQSEIDLLSKLSDRIKDVDIPIIVILTQSYSKNDSDSLRSVINKENLDILNVVPVLAEDYNIDDEYTAKAYGLDTLSEVMHNAIPDAVRKTFISLQVANIELKKGKAQAVVAVSAATAAATGAVPIPFSDAAILVPEQISMIAAITAIFGITIDKTTMISVITGTLGTAGATILGKTVVAGLLKFIPGAGTVAGGVISGTTAAALTAALGEAYIIVLTMVCNDEIKISELATDAGKKIISNIFKQQLKLTRNKKGLPNK